MARSCASAVQPVLRAAGKASGLGGDLRPVHRRGTAARPAAGEFMQDHAIAPRERAVTDQAFRRLRRLGGLEARLRLLLTAEIIGIVFYRALEVVTDCRRLQILCRTLVADELVHVAFESQLLLALKNGRRRPDPAAAGCLGAGAAHRRGAGGVGHAPTGAEVRRLRAAAVPARLPQSVRLLSEMAAGPAVAGARAARPLSPHGN